MNFCYRLVFNTRLQLWQAVSEIAKARGKSSRQAIGLVTAYLLACSGMLAQNAYAAPSVNALPTGGQVVGGQSSISQNGSVLNIRQYTQKSIINWAKYNIGAGATVNYFQPNGQAISLNRVLSADPSQIFGKLNANGQVWLINPNGVMFGKGAQVNVGGLLASTLNINDDDFMNGHYHFSGSGMASVLNQGDINASYVAMLSPQVVNEGVISAQRGNVVMAAGEAMTLDFGSSGLINVQVDATQVNTLIANKHLIDVGGGQVLMTTKAASDLTDSVINNSGTIVADNLVNDGGTVRLVGANTVLNSGSISAKSAARKGGSVHLLGDKVGVVDNGSIDVSGKTGGGEILVGGDYQGKNTNIQNAKKTYVSQNAKLVADATEQGDGGKVIVWADDVTRYYGSISAKGGAKGGNGGFAEISGKRLLNFLGKADLSAAYGRGGNLLLDPTNITLSLGVDANTAGFTVPGDLTEAFADDSGLNSVFNVGAGGSFAGIAAGSTITLQATNDIDVNSAFNLNTATGSANNSLVLQANNNINLNATITASGTGSVSLIANADNTGGGNIAMGTSSINTQSGNITLSGVNISKAAGTITAIGAGGANSGNININATGTVALGTGNVSASPGTGTGTAGANAGNITIAAGTGITGTASMIAVGSTATGAGLNGGNAGNVTITSATGNITTGTITASGGTAGTGTASGGNAGAINVTATAGNVTVGAANAQAGISTGTGAGGAAGSVNVSGTNVTLGAINTSGSALSNANGGAITATATGALTMNGAVNSSGGTVNTGNAGKNAGAVMLTAGSIASAAAGTITASGSNGSGTNQNGGNGAAININASGAISMRAATASGGNGVATSAKGGNAGSISITTSSGNISTNTGALTARTGAGVGVGVNAAAGFISINNTSAAGTIVTRALNTSGNTNGAGGNISVTGNGTVTVTGTISSSGGASTGTRAGQNAGNVTITGTNRSVTGAITASGGAGIGTNQAGGNAGVVSITGSGTLGVAAITARTGNATGTGAGGVAGSITLIGSSISSGAGALTTTGGTNGAGGNISVTASAGNITSGAISSAGGGVNAGVSGKNAGNITLNAAAGSITNSGNVSAVGSTGNGANQAGGNSGNISMTAANGISITGTLSADGGNVGAGSTTVASGNAGIINLSNATTGNINITGQTSAIAGQSAGTGAGGTAGSITLANAAAGGNVTTTNIRANGGTNSHGSNVVINSAAGVTVNGTINTSGGAATGTRAGRNAGNVTITGVNRSVTGAITASGGAASGTNQAGGNAGVVSITGTGTLSTAGITASTGARTGAGAGGTAGSITLSGSSATTGALSTAPGTGGVGGNVNITTTGAATSTVASINATTNGAVTLNVADTLTVSGIIQGTGTTLTKTGAGTVVLNGANTYTGVTNVNAGTLQANNSAALGGTGTGTTVANGATLNVNNVTLNNEAITINGTGVGGNGALTGTGAAVVGGNVTTGSVSAMGATTLASSLTINGTVTAPNTLSIVGLGDITATNAANNFSTVNINGANDVNLRDTNAMTFGGANSTLTGNLTARAATDITLNNTITTTGGDILLTANRFINNAGSGAVAASGRWVVHTADHALNTYGGLASGNQAIWGRALGVATAETGNRYVFANSPVVTVTSTNQSKTYGQDGAPIVANAYTATGFVNAASFGNVFTQDTATNALTGNATSTGSATTANVGSYAIDVTPIIATTGYTLTKNSTGLLTVNQANLTITANNQTKTYGSTFSFAGTEFTSSGLQNGESIGSVTLNSAGAANNANVGSYGIAASAPIGGTFSASNYNISFVDGTMTVNPAVINLSGTKTYDGNTNFGAASFGTINGLLGQTLMVTGTGTVASKNAGAAQPLTLGSLALADGTGLASNYTLTGGTHTGTINQATLNLNAVTDTKVYDGTTSSAQAVNVAGLQVGDSVSSLSQSYASKNVLGANGSTLAVDAGYVINDGNGGNNYTINENTATGTITPLAIVGSITANNKTYDGTDGATIATRTLAGVIGLDDVAYTGGTANFDNKNAGVGKTVTATGLSLSGADANNYSVNSTANTTANINQATLNLNAVTDTKVYDGTTSSAQAVNVVGLQVGDSVSSLSQSYASKNVLGANGSTLAVDAGYVINDGNGGNNYTINENTATGTITPKNLDVTANNQSKTYGQTINFAGTEFTSSGLVIGETIGSASIASAGALNTANVAGGPYVINISNATGGTFDANNYNITYNTGLLTVNRAPLTIKANNVNRPQGAPNPAFTSTISGFVNGENSSVLIGSLLHSTPAVASSPVGIYAITPSGVTADNYAITFVDGVLTVGAAITPAVFNTALVGNYGVTNNNCAIESSDNMLSGLENFDLEDVAYRKAFEQAEVRGSIANVAANGTCQHL